MDKTAIITGGTSGIGWGIAKKLSDQGYAVVLFAAETLEEAEEPLNYLRNRGRPHLYIQGDLAAVDQHRPLLQATLDRFGRVDLLVNNAGVVTRRRQDMLLLNPDDYDYVFNINLRGTFFLTQTIGGHMLGQEEREGSRGQIVFTESSNSTVASVQRGEYCMSKAGIKMMTQLFAARLGPEGIYVYGIRPGIIATRKTYQVKERYDAVTASDEMIVKRWGLPEDCAEAVWALCGSPLPYCNGTVLKVDGGFIQRRL